MADSTPGPVHNAMRRMTELIDLEKFDSYFDGLIRDSGHNNGNHGNTDNKPPEKEFDTLSEDLPPHPLPCVNDRRRSQAHVVTIKSYTEIFYERKQDIHEDDDDEEESEEEVFPLRAKTEQQPDTGQPSTRNTSSNIQPAKREKKISTSSRVSNKSSLEKNAWGRVDYTRAKSQYDKEDRTCCALVFKFLFGVNGEYKWYSLKGKGLCCVLPMILMYIIICLLLLPVLIGAAIVSSILICASLCSYLSLASKKVGVSIDEENDKSCLEAIWWWT